MNVEKTNGQIFVEELNSRQFRTLSVPSYHGSNFSSYVENYYLFIFKKYMSSCGRYLMDKRLKQLRTWKY